MKNDNAPVGCALIIFIICIAINLMFAYFIATSDMPLWLKFWLLK